jgi:hypothetical protein
MKGYKADDKYLPSVRQQASSDFQSESSDIFLDETPEDSVSVKENETKTIEELLNKEENILDVKQPKEKKEEKSDESDSNSRKIITS